MNTARPGRMRRRLLGLGVAAVMFAWLFCPLPQPAGIGVIEGKGGVPGNAAVHEERFVCNRTSDRITISGAAQLTSGTVAIDLLDADGRHLVEHLPLNGHGNRSWTFGVGDGFPEGRAYRLRCTERGVVGPYRVSRSQGQPVTHSQRYLALWAVVVAASASRVVSGFST